MPSTYSPLLRLELQAAGENSNTWGDKLNVNLGTLLEKSIAGAVNIDVTGADVTLGTNSGVDDQARCAIILVAGSPGVLRNIIAPSISKTYVIFNGSNSQVVIKGAATTGTQLQIGEYAQVMWNGADFIRVGVSSISPVFSGFPQATTAAPGDSSTKLATTAFVTAAPFAPLNGFGTSGVWNISITGTAVTATTLAGIGLPAIAYNANVDLTNIDISNPTYDGNYRAGWAYGNGANSNGPSSPPNYGVFSSMQGGSFENQMILGDASGPIFYRTRFIPTAWASIPWKQILTTNELSLTKIANAVGNTYTPSIGTTFQASSVSVALCKVIRQDGIVAVTGRLSATPTTANSFMQVALSLPYLIGVPVLDSLTGLVHPYGQFSGAVYGNGGTIDCGSGTQAATLTISTGSATTPISYYFHFTYSV